MTYSVANEIKAIPEKYGGTAAIIAQARTIWRSDVLGGEMYVLLLPHCDARFNALFRTAFAAKLGDRRGLVVEGGRAEVLLALYSLYAFTDKLIIGSFDLPHGRKLRNLLECGIATEEELINDVMLGAM